MDRAALLNKHLDDFFERTHNKTITKENLLDCASKNHVDISEDHFAIFKINDFYIELLWPYCTKEFGYDNLKKRFIKLTKELGRDKVMLATRTKSHLRGLIKSGFKIISVTESEKYILEYDIDHVVAQQ